MRHSVLALRPRAAVDLCEHCQERVPRVWLVPGDVLSSCRACFVRATGSEPVHEQGHSSAPAPRPAAQPFPRSASFPRWRTA